MYEISLYAVNCKKKKKNGVSGSGDNIRIQARVEEKRQLKRKKLVNSAVC